MNRIALAASGVALSIAGLLASPAAWLYQDLVKAANIKFPD